MFSEFSDSQNMSDVTKGFLKPPDFSGISSIVNNHESMNPERNGF